MAEVKGTFEHINPHFMHNKLGRDVVLIFNFMFTMNTDVRLLGTSNAELEELSELQYYMVHTTHCCSRVR
eukprot:m51a1_g4204 hypothetical protein (70) ;mRNA; r:20331-20540